MAPLIDAQRHGSLCYFRIENWNGVACEAFPYLRASCEARVLKATSNSRIEPCAVFQLSEARAHYLWATTFDGTADYRFVFLQVLQKCWTPSRDINTIDLNYSGSERGNSELAHPEVVQWQANNLKGQCASLTTSTSKRRTNKVRQ